LIGLLGAPTRAANLKLIDADALALLERADPRPILVGGGSASSN
jgi:hypothetical protein